jgi:hypothetical protein
VLPADSGAVEGLRVGELPTQTDVRVRWTPNGPIRFAVVTAYSPENREYPITSVAAKTEGTFVPTVPTAAVRLTIAGANYTATLPGSPSTDEWLSGPLVKEWRETVVPVNGSSAHPFLRVVFDVRVYNDGKARLDFIVENTLNIPETAKITYDVAMLLDGSTVFSQPNVVHHVLSRYRKTFPARDLVTATITPDLDPFFKAHAFPRYLKGLKNEVDSTTGDRFGILNVGSVECPNMNEHGGRYDLAPYPGWVARYLVHKNPAQRVVVLVNGDLSGSWPIHIRQPEWSAVQGIGKERGISIDEWPNFWLDKRSHGSPEGMAFDPKFFYQVWYSYVGAKPEEPTVRINGREFPLVADNAHQPSLAYAPYILSGDRYYKEEVFYWANYGMLASFQDSFYNRRGGSEGLLRGNEVRGQAWVLRNLVDAAAYLPDGDPPKAYLGAKIANNLAHWEDQAKSYHTTFPGDTVLDDGYDYLGHRLIIQWSNNFRAWAIAHANAQGFSGSMLLALRTAQFPLQLLNSPDFPRIFVAPYKPIVALDADGRSPQYFTTIKQFKMRIGQSMRHRGRQRLTIWAATALIRAWR